MSEPHVSLDPRGLTPAQEKLREPLEEQLTSALQAAVERIRADYHGETLDIVRQRLLDETRDGLHPDIAARFRPDMDELTEVAAAIVRGDVP